MIRIALIAILSMSFVGCSLFHQDPTPALAALQELDTQFQDTIDSLRKIVENATGIDEAKRVQLLASIDKTEEFRVENVDALRQYLESLGSLDYKQLFEQLYADYKEIRKKLNEEDK